jgi:hypothetical protein
MRTYLSSEKLKELKSFLNEAIPKEMQTALKKLTAEGLELFTNTENNKQVMWSHYNDLVRKSGNAEFLRLQTAAQTYAMGDIVTAYIEKNYKQENQLIAAFHPQIIDYKVNGFGGIMQENHSEYLDIRALVLSESFDKYLEKYEKKNRDQELIKQAEKMASEIDRIYNPKIRNLESYNKYLAAQQAYFLSGDRNILYNILNEEYRY